MSWFKQQRTGRGNRTGSFQAARRPWLEELENRLAPAIFTVTSLADNVDASDGVLTLREALAAAQANGATADTINFAVTGTIDIASALPALNNVTLDGPGAKLLTIQRGSTDPLDAYRLLAASGSSAITGVTLANGLTIGSGGAVAGGALTVNGDVTLRGVHITGNRSASEGGGVAVLNGNLIVIDSTFSNNSANNGGAIWIGQGTSTLAVTNSTFSGNTATNNGGAIRLTGDESVSLLNVTIADNSAATGGGVAIASQGRLTAGNTIFAGNRATNGPDIRNVGSVAITSLGGNLLGNNSGAFFSAVATDRFGTSSSPLDPLLGLLADNGGPTPTHALLAGSPAFNAGNDVIAPATDQRGVPRPMAGQSDSGAFEVPLFVVTSLADTVDATDGVLTLREALLAAAATSVTDTITFAVTGTIDLDSALSMQNVYFSGPGADLLTIRRRSSDPATSHRLLNVSGSDNRIEGVTLANGATAGSGGAAAGGAIASNGNLLLRGVHVTGNSAPSEGGGVAILNGNLTVIDSTFSNNTANNGGAIWIGQGTSTLTVFNSTFSGNRAVSNGGAIRLTGDEETLLQNVTITNNSAATGGGVAIASQGRLTAGNTIFAGNAATNGPDIRNLASVAITSLGGNLVGKNSGAFFSFVASDQFGTAANPLDARLGPLANNGGPTPTHTLLAGSPAIERGDNAATPVDLLDADGDGDTTEPAPFDQRGLTFIRIADSADADLIQTVDVGAVERHPDIEDIGDKSTLEDTPMSFTFNVADIGLASLVVVSSNPMVVPSSNVQITGTGQTRTMTITPAADQNGTTIITVTVATLSGQTVQDSFSLHVTAVNDPPTFELLMGDPPMIDEGSGPQSVSNFAGNFQPGPATATDETPQTLTSYTVTLLSSTGTLTFNVPPTLSNAGILTYTIDPLTHGTATFQVMARDSGGADSVPLSFTISVNDVPPTAPVDVDSLPNRVDEGAAGGTPVGITAQSFDALGVTYTLLADGGGAFQIDSGNGVIRVAPGATIDHESIPGYSLRVRATDPSGQFRETDFFLLVDNLPPAVPADSDAALDSVTEGAASGTAVGITAFAADPAGGPVTYSLSDDAGGRFQIDSVTGLITVRDGSLLDSESGPLDLTITVRASDPSGLFQEATFNIHVTNEPPTAPVDSDTGANSVVESAAPGAAVGITARASDPAGGVVTYSLTDDAGGLFQIDSVSGIVRVAGPLDFETATSHDITVRASDPSAASRESTFTIAVINVNEVPTLTGLDHTPTFYLGGFPVTLDSAATAADVELNVPDDYAGAILTVARQGGAAADDLFDFDSSGAPLFFLNGSSLVDSNGRAFASVTNLGGTLSIHFTSSATAATSALINDVLRRIRYSNTGTTTGQVVLSYTFNDGNTGAQGSGGALWTTATITVNVTRPTITLTLAAPASIGEDGGSTLVYTLTRSGTLMTDQIVHFTIAGGVDHTDYTLSSDAPLVFDGSSGTVTFVGNADSVTVMLTPVADTDVEADESVILTIVPDVSYLVGTPDSQVGTIANDDASIAVSVSADAPEDGNGTLVYTFTRTGFLGRSLSVNYQASGTATGFTSTGTLDYAVNDASVGSSYGITTGAGVVVFAAGESARQVIVSPGDDFAWEDNETVIFTVGSGSGYLVGSPAAATGTILNDDPVPSAARGRVWFDVDGDGIQDTGEPGIAGATLTVTWLGPDGLPGGVDVDFTAITDADGNYSFSELPPGEYTVAVTTQPNGLTLATAGPSAFALISGNERDDIDFGFRGPGTIGDRLWYDDNLDGSDLGEPGIAGVTVEAVWFGFDGAEATIDDNVTYSTSTNAMGIYGFANLPLGHFRVTLETATLPADLVPTYDLDDGQLNPNSNTLVSLTQGSPTENRADFGYTGQRFIGERVWLDFNGDGKQDADEPGLAGVTVTLTWAGSDNDLNDAGDNIVLTTVTGANGTYGFSNIPAGLFQVAITGGLPAGVIATGDPDPIKDGVTQLTIGRNDTITSIDFGYQGNSSLAGFAYRDFNTDGIRQPAGVHGETGISGVVVTLTGTDSRGSSITRVLATAVDGSYSFGGLLAGDYLITETQPVSALVDGPNGFYDGRDSVGTVNGVTAGNSPAKNQFAVTLPTGADGIEFNFGESPPADPFGFVYIDLDNDGRREAGEPGIAGVSITVSGMTALGTVLTAADVPGGLTRVTDASGFWQFAILPPGTYSFVETQPLAFDDGLEEDADPNGPPTTLGNDRFDNVVLTSVPVRGPFNFGERAMNGMLSGTVYVDTNNNGLRDGAEWRLPGVTVLLTGTDATGAAVQASAVTDANGNFQFIRLQAGTYQLRELQPGRFLDGLEHAGSLGGVARNDVIASIVIGPNQSATGYTFGERGLLPVVTTKRQLLANSQMSTMSDPAGSGIAIVNPISGALRLSVPALSGLEVSGLTDGQLAATVELAINIFASIDPDLVDRLRSIQFQISSLSDTLLGLASGNTVFIDSDAAGHGWSLDHTAVTPTQADLLSVILHELGHNLGLSHTEPGFMSEFLNLGTRSLPPSTSDLDALFNDSGLQEWLGEL